MYNTNYRDAPATLRTIADSIESGEYGAVGSVALVVLGDQLHVFGVGRDSDPTSVHYLLCCGARKMENAALEHGQ